jgi:uncharacterized lipoprotein NlpE involved in copper resistance
MKPILLVSVAFYLVGCAAQNQRDQDVADRNYLQCVHAAAQTLAVSSNAPADVVAATAARACPDHLRMVEGSRVLPLGGAAEAAEFAENLTREMTKTLVADVEQARRGKQNR